MTRQGGVGTNLYQHGPENGPSVCTSAAVAIGPVKCGQMPTGVGLAEGRNLQHLRNAADVRQRGADVIEDPCSQSADKNPSDAPTLRRASTGTDVIFPEFRQFPRAPARPPLGSSTKYGSYSSIRRCMPARHRRNRTADGSRSPSHRPGRPPRALPCSSAPLHGPVAAYCRLRPQPPCPAARPGTPGSRIRRSL